MKLAILRFVGFVMAFIGLCSLASYGESGTHFFASVLVMAIGIFLLWTENLMNPIDRQWDEIERRRRCRR